MLMYKSNRENPD